MAMERDISYLRSLASSTDSAVAGNLERIIRLMELLQTAPDSPSEHSDRAGKAANELRSLNGLDREIHNEVCLIAERLDALSAELSQLSNAVGY